MVAFVLVVDVRVLKLDVAEAVVVSPLFWNVFVEHMCLAFQEGVYIPATIQLVVLRVIQVAFRQSRRISSFIGKYHLSCILSSTIEI